MGLTLAALFAMGLLLIVFSTLTSALLQLGAPGSLRGRVMSVYTLAWQGLEYVGVLLTGSLASLWGASAAVFGSAVVIALVLLGIGLRQRALSRGA